MVLVSFVDMCGSEIALPDLSSKYVRIVGAHPCVILKFALTVVRLFYFVDSNSNCAEKVLNCTVSVSIVNLRASKRPLTDIYA